jgi:hypothetical protein
MHGHQRAALAIEPAEVMREFLEQQILPRFTGRSNDQTRN